MGLYFSRVPYITRVQATPSHVTFFRNSYNFTSTHTNVLFAVIQTLAIVCLDPEHKLKRDERNDTIYNVKLMQLGHFFIGIFTVEVMGEFTGLRRQCKVNVNQTLNLLFAAGQIKIKKLVMYFYLLDDDDLMYLPINNEQV